ncbi:Hypothetical protein D9617_30g011700 [Elsinoe fawcettii]|nr:Hypothetical protein D9617_30g011700 [Elsinoe fawcettii]
MRPTRISKLRRIQDGDRSKAMEAPNLSNARTTHAPDSITPSISVRNDPFDDETMYDSLTEYDWYMMQESYQCENSFSSAENYLPSNYSIQSIPDIVAVESEDEGNLWGINTTVGLDDGSAVNNTGIKNHGPSTEETVGTQMSTATTIAQETLDASVHGRMPVVKHNDSYLPGPLTDTVQQPAEDEETSLQDYKSLARGGKRDEPAILRTHSDGVIAGSGQETLPIPTEFFHHSTPPVECLCEPTMPTECRSALPTPASDILSPCYLNTRATMTSPYAFPTTLPASSGAQNFAETRLLTKATGNLRA